MPMTLEEFTQDIDHLVSLPSVGMRVNEIVNDPNSNADDIGKLISQDPALVTRVLRIANSPAYGLSTQITTITRAVSIVGTQLIRDLVLATSTISAFKTSGTSWSAWKISGTTVCTAALRRAFWPNNAV